jgi:hypothetical protein
MQPAKAVGASVAAWEMAGTLRFWRDEHVTKQLAEFGDAPERVQNAGKNSDN